MKAKLEQVTSCFPDYREPYCAALIGITPVLATSPARSSAKMPFVPCDSKVVQAIATLACHHAGLQLMSQAI